MWSERYAQADGTLRQTSAASAGEHARARRERLSASRRLAELELEYASDAYSMLSPSLRYLGEPRRRAITTWTAGVPEGP